MSHKHKKSNSESWQKNWGTSIAVKVTAPVLWLLISIGLTIAVVTQNQFADDLPDLISSDADRVAYAAGKYLLDLEGGQPLELAQVLEQSMTDMYFESGRISVGLRTIDFGKTDANTDEYNKLTRPVPYTNKLEGGDSLIAELVLYHKPYTQIIKDQRKHILVQFGAVFFVFGLILVGLIHMIVTKPISQLVSATKSVSKGDLGSRLEIDREDEFGVLAELFNKMVDKLQNKQEQLTLAVKVAESASNAKSAFLANMSHEIRTPLTAILGFSSLLKDRSLQQNEAQQHVDSIIRAGNHLHQIINDILDMSKIEAGQLVIDSAPVNLVEMLNEIDSLMRPNATEKRLNFRIKYNFPLPRVIVTDATRLKQILLNLCSNAIKFTSDGNVDITVQYDKKKNTVLFDVTDTGVGMTQEEVDNLFVAFSQVDSSSTRRFGGTGLGLCICKELATNLGGDIQCQSRKGIGSRFSFYIDPGVITEDLLVDGFEKEHTTTEQKIISIEPGSLTGRVLLAEDTPDNQKLIAMYVSRAGASAVVVENGKQAVDMALQENYDLILMDMQMPVMDGLEATARLRSIGYDKPIVALTANALREDREQSLRVGVDDYLTKPVDLNRFNAVLKQYLSTKESARDFQGKEGAYDSAFIQCADDPEFLALLRQFEAELPERINAIKLAAKQQNWVELKSLVHKLKGLGGSFGYQALSLIAAEMQQQLSRDSYDSMVELARQLEYSCNPHFDQNKKSSNF